MSRQLSIVRFSEYTKAWTALPSWSRVDNVDLSAATENQVLVTKVLGPIERQAVAEHAIALLMNELRKINKGQRLIKMMSGTCGRVVIVLNSSTQRSV